MTTATATAPLGPPGLGAPLPLDVPKPHITPTPPATGVQGSSRSRSSHAELASERFAALERGLMIPSAGTEPITVKEFSGRPERGSSWPHGQMVAATLDRAMLTGDFTMAERALRGFDRFRSPDGAITDFSPADWPAENGPMYRYYDDNAWAGLDYAQAWHQTGKPEYLARATEFFDFLMQAKGANGGLRWKESLDHLNTASTGPALQLALRLYSATGDERFMREATEMDKFMSGPIRRADGLLQDHINTDGSIEPTIWSYNTGVAIGADVQFYEILKLTDERAAKRHLDRAVSTARSAMAYFGSEDRLWKQNPAFNAILFRNLLNLDRVAPDPRIRVMLTNYLARIESTAISPEGLVDGGGIGRYDNGKTDTGTPLIDQAAVVQMHALLAMSPEQLAAVS